MKESKLSFPELEDRLKRTRMFATQMAESAVDETKCMVVDKYKDSCVEDATEYKIIEDPDVYIKHGHTPGNGTTLLRVTFPPKTISEHYHRHPESIIVEDGLVSFAFGGCDVILDQGSSIKIPSNSFHTCEFKEETIAVVGLPTKWVKKHLAFPAS